MVGTSRTTTPRSPVVDNRESRETRERNNSDDEYDNGSAYDYHVSCIMLALLC